MTNNHVVSGAKQIQVTLDNGDIFSAKVVGTDSTTDLAVIKLDNPPKDLTPITFANSDSLAPGEPLMAIGNPLDTSSLANTTTFGVISAAAREVTIDGHTNTYLQTDAAINFGNSGGPQHNKRGDVIRNNNAKPNTTGYDEYGNMVIVPDEAEVVSFIYEKYLDGWTVKEIAAHLTKEGIPTVKGLDVWPVGSVYNILRNDKFCLDFHGCVNYFIRYAGRPAMAENRITEYNKESKTVS